ncbi:sigma-70 family RNA polymerase sigma factor [Streptomyces argyrophyllae]|uniref:Sigma-70 family RNA polymerase sigma factor n=1 Tax=Streptomyces argyrophylli TaxID=2726118 RepID=A0A6M4PFV8_9ACTN|nr:sigma-70 family RNA polymerase sigma factor [Streptomyces argyrophyllae]
MSNDEIFAAAYREHYWAVSRYVARRLQGRTDEVEEVVAEVFTVAWRRRADLPAAPLPWLYGVARNCLANAVRGYGRRRRLVDRLGNDEAAHGRHVAAGPDAEAPGAWVHEALDRLSPADQEVLRLAAWEELGAEEIAVALGCGRRAAAMRLHRARRRLRTEIDRLSPAEPPAGPRPSPSPPSPAALAEVSSAEPSLEAPPKAIPGGPTPDGDTRPGRRTSLPLPTPDATLRKDPRHA